MSEMVAIHPVLGLQMSDDGYDGRPAPHLAFDLAGRGTFVAPRIEAPGSTLSGFSDDALRRGEKPGVIWMFKNYASPTEDEAQALEITPATKVARLGRVRLLGGEPLAIEHAVVPARFLPVLE
jgi:GntR family transcriptional regulator